MVLEVAALDIILGQEANFRRSFAVALESIVSMPGYLSHELKRSIENPSR